jgi:hypothetical protein
MGSVTAQSTQLQKRWEFHESNLSNDWEIVTRGAGQSLTPSSGTLKIDAGVGSNEVFTLRCKTSCSPRAFLRWTVLVSQRITNQDIYLELSTRDGQTRASYRLAGTNSNTALLEVVKAGFMYSAPSLTLAAGSSTLQHLDIIADIEAVFFGSSNINAGSSKATGMVDVSIPTQDDVLYPVLRIVNGATAPATNTTITLHSVTLEDLTAVSVDQSFQAGLTSGAAALPMRMQGGSVDSVGAVGNKITAYTETTTNLTSGQIFTGPSRDITSFQQGMFTGFCYADVSGTLYVEESIDGSTFYPMQQIPVPAGLAVKFENRMHSRYARVRYVNGVTAQTTFRISSTVSAF